MKSKRDKHNIVSNELRKKWDGTERRRGGLTFGISLINSI